MRVMPCDVVSLNSGGPEMTVTHCQINDFHTVGCSSLTKADSPNKHAEVCADWFDVDGLLRSACFPLQALKHPG